VIRNSDKGVKSATVALAQFIVMFISVTGVVDSVAISCVHIGKQERDCDSGDAKSSG